MIASQNSDKRQIW